MTRLLTLMLMCTLSATTWAAAAAPVAGPQTEEEKTAYAIGQIVGSNLKSFTFSQHEIQMVESGFAIGLQGAKPAIDVETYRSKAQALQVARVGAQVGKTKEAGKAFRDKAAAAKNTETTASGIVITTLSEGSGAAPAASDQVKVHYEGKLIDGTVFDSSIKRGEPMTFKLTGVVPCWTEALQRMKVGGKSQIVCPSEVAYGDRGSPPMIPGGATLVFNVELLEIVK
jgi:FKBP-type peptidyl-prolyl cis-trans isomerase FkpA